MAAILEKMNALKDMCFLKHTYLINYIRISAGLFSVRGSQAFSKGQRLSL